MLAESLLKNRVLEAVCEKSYKPGAATSGRSGGSGQPAVFRAGGVPVFERVEVRRTGIGAKSQRARSRGCSSG